MGGKRLVGRLGRRWRQRVVYPRRGATLFPWPKALEDTDDAVPFDERRAAAQRPRESLLALADDLVARRFTYLGLETQDLGEPADWQRAPLQDPLWCYNLHYGQWAVDLLHAFLVTDDRRYRATCIELVEDWLEGNPVARQPAWEPYPLCRRVVTWSRIVGALGSGSSIGRRFFRRRMEPSLRQQASFLVANLEADVPNNHLIANFKALAWLGLLFPAWPEAASLKALGLEGLWREMRRQVLDDGVHDERSISYHCIVLQDLLEVRWLAARRGVEVPADVDPTLRRMLDVLTVTRGPAGRWPMTGDTVTGYPLDPQSLCRAASIVLSVAVPGTAPSTGGGGEDPWYPAWLGCDDEDAPAVAVTPPETSSDPPPPASWDVLPQAGWAVLRGPEDSFLFFDAGAIGPDHVLGHAHADALSFELHLGQLPMLVDPGVCTYRAGPLRDRFRSTAVHNTVTVDGEDQCVFWGPFRVARPPRTGLSVDDAAVAAEGWHDGYRRLRGAIVHRRRIQWQGDGWEVRDQLQGKGRHRFVSSLQLAPGAVASVDGKHGEARWPDGAVLRLEVLEDGDAVGLELASGEVSPTWNTILPAPCWRLSWRAEGSSEVTFRLTAVVGAGAETR